MSDRKTGVLFLISAPSGAGKTTVCGNLLDANPSLVRAITCTTRQPREGEQHGVDYYFLSREAFDEKIEQHEFLEHAEVYGNRYGTLKAEVRRLLEEGKDVLLNIDVQGASLIRSRAANDSLVRDCLVTAFLTPGTWEELERRLRARGSESESVIKTRLKAAAMELEASREFDYLVLSQSMEEDRRRMEMILEAESLRRSRHELPLTLTEGALNWGQQHD